VPPVWFTGPRGVPYEPGHFSRVIAIEPFQHPAIGDTIDPVVICNRDESRPAQALRARLGTAPDEPLVVVTHAGARGEVQTLANGAEKAVRLDLFDPAALFPLAEWLSGADQVISAGGYNAYWEARWLGYASRTRFMALRRAIDDQAWRVRAGDGYAMRANGADVLATWLSRG
jgi:hypothetical protein